MSKSSKFGLRMKTDALSFSQDLWQAIDTPISLSCYLLAKYGELKQLVSKDIDPLSYTTPAEYFTDAQAISLLSKYPYLDTKIDKRAVATKKFIDCEVKCKETNYQFKLRRQFPTRFKTSGKVSAIFHRAQQKIASILGDVPSYSDLDFRFGPGASFSVRKETSVFNKVSSTLECTFAFTEILGKFLAEFPGWLPLETDHTVNLRRGSQLTFVPKTAKTDRPICIEPTLNGLYQKGIGSFIRDRLKTHGVDLNDQTVNQRLASVAHVESLSTIDFASASDTISYMLVLDLLPTQWVEALDVARCPSYLIEGEYYDFHKFSSMGNAYTFELESLIFYALAYATCAESGLPIKTGTNLSVYGDDVIIPRAAVDLFSEVIEVAGFSINKEKSFISGPFFESCGEDFYLGVPVRPFFLKKSLTNVSEVFKLANNIQLFRSRLCDALGLDVSDHEDHPTLNRLGRLHAKLIKAIPKKLRFLGPYGSGDGSLVAPFDVARPVRLGKKDKSQAWQEGYHYKSIHAKQIKRYPKGDFPMGYALYFNGDLHHIIASNPPDNGSGYATRGHTVFACSGKVWFDDWPDAFPWHSASLGVLAR